MLGESKTDMARATCKCEWENLILFLCLGSIVIVDEALLQRIAGNK